MIEDQERGLGDNMLKSENRSLVEQIHYLNNALHEAFKFVAKTINKSDRVQTSLTKAVDGSNVVARGIALADAVKINNTAVKDLMPFAKVCEAIKHTQDIHSAPWKTHKLDMCSEAGNFGNFVANSTNDVIEIQNLEHAIKDAQYETFHELEAENEK